MRWFFFFKHFQYRSSKHSGQALKPEKNQPWFLILQIKTIDNPRNLVSVWDSSV